jgi:phosphoribosyl 1,2-cyclic phosphodiesterase
VEVRCGDRVIVLDAGTGIRQLGLDLVEQGVTEVDLLVSHFHMDHMQGFPFFTPSYNPAVRINIYLPQLSEGRPLAEPFHTLMQEPQFPIPFRVLAADIRFHETSGSGHLGEVAVKSHLLNHPGGCVSYRLEHQGKSVVYMTDHEPFGNAADEAIREFARGADLLIREAQYSTAEYESHRGWGHGTFEDAVGDALAAGVKRLALFHHDPQHDDRFLEQQLRQLRRRYSNSALDISLAREGQCVELG